MMREHELDLMSAAFGCIGDDIIERSDIESIEKYYSEKKRSTAPNALKRFAKYSSRIAAGFAATFVGFAVLLAVLMNVMFGGFGCKSSDNMYKDSSDENSDLLFSYPESGSYAENFPSLYPDDNYFSDGSRLPWEDDIYAALSRVDNTGNSRSDNSLYFTVGLKGDYLGSGDIYIKIDSDTLKIDASEEINDGIIVIDDLYASDSREKIIELAFKKISDKAESGIISLEIGYKFDDPDAFVEKLKSYERYDIIDINRIFKNGVLCITKFSVDVSKFID